LQEHIEEMATMVISHRFENMFFVHALIIRYQMVTCQAAEFGGDSATGTGVKCIGGWGAGSYRG
jgi:hypothetical protein